MSSKHLRRLLEEKEKSFEDDNEALNKEEAAPSRQNLFLFLDDEDSEKKDSENNSSEKEEENPLKQSASNQSSKKKTKKKKKKKGKKPEETELEMMDNFAKEAREEESKERFDFATMKDVFKVDPKRFCPREELKAALGKAFKEPTMQPKSHNQKKLSGRIVKASPQWPQLKNLGLSMKPCNKTNTEFRFVFGRYYGTLERMGIIGERSMDVSVAQGIIQTEHWHLHSLLILATASIMQDEISNAMDYIERGIYFCEQSWNPMYDYTSMEHHIPYKYYENRIYYLLLHKYMLLCCKKRCFETALNYAKLICLLDIRADPLGMFLILDTLAIKAKKYDWFHSLLRAYEVNKKMRLLPNFAYSKAMVAFLQAKTAEDHKKADDLLEDAIKKFPGVVTHLIDVLQIQVEYDLQVNSFMNDLAFSRETEGFKLVVKIYVQESKELWKQSEVLLWLENVTRNVCIESNKKGSSQTIKVMTDWTEKRRKMYVGVAEEVQRLAVLLGLISNESTMTDPVPPGGEVNEYLSDSVLRRADAEESIFASFFNSILPDYDPTVPLVDRILGMTDRYIEHMNRWLGRDATQEEAEDAFRAVAQVIGAAGGEPHPGAPAEERHDEREESDNE